MANCPKEGVVSTPALQPGIQLPTSQAAIVKGLNTIKDKGTANQRKVKLIFDILNLHF